LNDIYLFFHPKILAQKIIKEIDKLEGDLYENHDRIELCLPQNLICFFPNKSDRDDLINLIWDIFYKIRTYQISRHVFVYKDTKYILSAYKKEWELNIKAYIELWEGEQELTIITPSYYQYDDPELIDILYKKNFKIIKFPKVKSKNK
tara:strand:+ start:2325 stop:2768 length:444 start_codon:yes stop_codon:yes gene_type:complete